MYTIIMITALLILYLCMGDRKQRKGLFISVNILAGSCYLLWRFTTIPEDNVTGLILGILLLAAEILGFIQFAFTQYLFFRKNKLPDHALTDYGNNFPTVDVLICTYNEPLTLLEKTIIAAKRLRYDKSRLRIYVCDDGRRDDLQKMCCEYEVGYFTRENRNGAKAGNLNNALMHTEGELFAVLDADMVCAPGFLERTAGYFIDENTAFVQTPQVYYNKDMYQQNLKKEIPNEQDFFMRDIQEGLASINAVLHVGTNAVFRRSAAKAAGYYPTNAITEDMAMGMNLQSMGYKGIFVNEMLVFGLSADTYVDLAKQRDRWCRGNLQVARHFRPFFEGGLDIRQKFAYLNGFLYWFTSIQKMIYLFCPLWFLFTSQRSIDASFDQLYAMFIPYYLGILLAFWSLVPDTRSLKWAHIYDLAMAPHISMSIIKELFHQKKEFIVTPKHAGREKSYFQLGIVIPHILFIFFTIIAWLCGFLYLKSGQIGPGAYAVNIVWSIYNFVGLLICVRAAYHVSGIEPEPYGVIPGGKVAVISFDGKKYPCVIEKISNVSLWLQLSDSAPFTVHSKVCLNFVQNKCHCKIKCPVQAVTDHGLELCLESLTVREKEWLYGIWVDRLGPYYHIER